MFILLTLLPRCLFSRKDGVKMNGRKTYRRILAVLIAVLMVLNLNFGSAFAFEGDGNSDAPIVTEGGEETAEEAPVKLTKKKKK